MSANYVRVKTYTPEEQKRILERKISYKKKRLLEMTSEIESLSIKVEKYTKEVKELEERLEKQQLEEEVEND